MDYVAPTTSIFNVTISAGLRSSLFRINITDDIIQEDNETFNITIKLLSNCVALSLGTSSSVVTIIDNDGMNIL